MINTHSIKYITYVIHSPGCGFANIGQSDSMTDAVIIQSNYLLANYSDFPKMEFKITIQQVTEVELCI